MNAEILSIGTELLLGDIMNTNAAFISRELAALGIGCYYQSVVGDNAGRLEESIKLAFSRADMVITTGGLGPTFDDITKETVAAYFGLEMELHQPSYDHIKSFFERVGRAFTKNNEKQAYMPKGATIFENNRGTAPGLAVEGKGKIAIMMPGPPFEMNSMFTEKVRPFLQARADKIFLSRNIHLFGIGESAAETLLNEAIPNPPQNPTIAPYAKFGEVSLRVTANAQNEQEAQSLLDPVVKEIEALFPKYVYGIDVKNMQSALAQKLLEKNLTIAIAESCTGGLIASRLTEIPGISKSFLCGVTCYSNESKQILLSIDKEIITTHGVVSREVALEMARAVQKISGADIGLAVTGIAGPDGGTPEKPVGLVFIACAGPWGEKVLEANLRRGLSNDRDVIRNMAALSAMNMVLRELNML